MKKSLLIMACLGILVAVFESTPVMAQGLKKHKIVIPRNSVFVLNYFGGKDAGYNLWITVTPGNTLLLR